MHFQTALATLAALVSLANADKLIVDVEVDLNNNHKFSNGRWVTAYDTHPVDPRAGCRDPPHVPGMNWLCLDWHPDRRRGHFYFDRQGKRCISFLGPRDSGFRWREPCPDKKACWTWHVAETQCTW